MEKRGGAKKERAVAIARTRASGCITAEPRGQIYERERERATNTHTPTRRGRRRRGGKNDVKAPPQQCTGDIEAQTQGEVTQNPAGPTKSYEAARG